MGNRRRLLVFVPAALAIACLWHLEVADLPAASRALAEEAPVAVAPLADPPRSIDELCRRIGKVLDREGVPGVAIALVGRDGPIWVGGVGVADLETRAPVTADTVFRVASITKMVVALGAMHLVEQGRLDLDGPLRLPGVTIDNAWDAVAPVTLAEVLEHTAGLDDMHFNETFTTDDALSPADALAINPRSRVVRWRPGTRMAYSNIGYTLAARAIEIATGEPFDAYLRREVLRPLGMRDADFQRTAPLAARLATGYVERGRATPFQPIAHRPAGALLASAADLARLVQFWLRRDGTIVSPAGLARIERARTLPYPRTDVDYGLGNAGDVSLPVRARGHNGGLPGFASELRYFPELGVGYAILLNATFSPEAYLDIRQLVFGYLARGRAQPRSPALPPEQPGARFFAFASPRHALFGFIERAVLGWRATPGVGGIDLEPLLGDALYVVPAGDGGYRFPFESGSSIRFTQAGDGAPVMLAHGLYCEAASYGLARVRSLALMLALALLELAPLWALVTVAIAVLRRRRLIALDLLAWPAVASLCFVSLPRLFVAAALRNVLGVIHPLTIAIWATTWLFALASAAGVLAALRWSRRPDRPSLTSRLVPSVTAIAALALAAWLGAHGIIGLRTWAW